MKKFSLSILAFLWGAIIYAQCVQVAPYVESFDTSSTPTCWNNPIKATIFGVSMRWFFGNDANPGPLGPQGAAGSVDDHSGNGGNFAYAYAGYGPNLDLESPPIDVTGLTTPGLTFWMFASTGGANVNSMYVDIYSYSTGSWTASVASQGWV